MTFGRSSEGARSGDVTVLPSPTGMAGLTGSIGPLVGRDPASAADALRAELARAPRASVVIPGSARSMVGVAVEARLKLVSPPGNLLLSAEVPAPDSLAISSYFLY